jgi:hypothetical protein
MLKRVLSLYIRAEYKRLDSSSRRVRKVRLVFNTSERKVRSTRKKGQVNTERGCSGHHVKSQVNTTDGRVRQSKIRGQHIRRVMSTEGHINQKDQVNASEEARSIRQGSTYQKKSQVVM